MKTTVEIQDELMTRAKRHAKRTGRPFRAIVEDGLRLVLSDAGHSTRYKLPDRSVGNAADEDPLEALSRQDLREAIYGKS